MLQSCGKDFNLLGDPEKIGSQDSPEINVDSIPSFDEVTQGASIGFTSEVKNFFAGTLVINGSCQAGTQIVLENSEITPNPTEFVCPASSTYEQNITFNSGVNTEQIINTNIDGEQVEQATTFIDTTAPSVVVSSPMPGSTIGNAAFINLTCDEVGSTITITNNEITPNPTTYTCTSTTAVNVPITWNSSADSSSQSISVVASDDLGNNSTPIIINPINIDLSTPAAPSITSPTIGQTVTNPTTVSGTCETGTTVKITNSNITPNPTTTTCTGGTYSTTVTWTTGADGNTESLSVTQEDSAGNESPAATVAIDVDISAPATPTITAPTAGTNLSNTTVTGTCDNSGSVSITSPNIASDPVVAACVGGVYSVAVTFDSGIDVSNETISVTGVDTVGNSSTAATVDIDLDTLAPSAVDDSYTGNNGAIGNVQLVSTMIDLNTLSENDASADTNGPVTLIAESNVATSLGGIVDIAADGSFSYNPPIGITDDTDTFTYKITDALGNQASATVSVQIQEMVWFVQNNEPSNGDGRFTAPFDNLDDAETAAKEDEYIFIYEGDGSNTNQNNQLALEHDGLKVVGEGSGLKLLNRTVVAVGNHPVIGPAGGGSRSVAISADDLEIRGIAIDDTNGGHCLHSALEVDNITIENNQFKACDRVLNIANISGNVIIRNNTTEGSLFEIITLATTGDNTANFHIYGNVLSDTVVGSISDTAIDITLGNGTSTGAARSTVNIFDNTMEGSADAFSASIINVIVNENNTESDITIDNNIISTTNTVGILIETPITGTEKSEIQISRNTLTGTRTRGIEYLGHSPISIADNNITQAGVGTSFGIYARTYEGNVVIDNNTITGNTTNHIRVFGMKSSFNHLLRINGNTLGGTSGTVLTCWPISSGSTVDCQVHGNTYTGNFGTGAELAFVGNSTTGNCSSFMNNDLTAASFSNAHFRANANSGNANNIYDASGTYIGTNSSEAVLRNMLTDTANGNTPTSGFTVDLVRVPTRANIISTPCGAADGKPNFAQNIVNQNINVATTRQISFTVLDDLDVAGTLNVSINSSDQTIVPDANLVATHIGAGVYTLDITTLEKEGATIIDISAIDSSLQIAHELFEITVLSIVPESCKSYLDADPTLKDGVYQIDPDGFGPLAAFDAYCDMTTAGGGWTMVLNYLHDGGTNPALLVKTTNLPLPDSSTLGVNESASTTSWGHAGNALMNHFNFTDTRYFCQTSGNPRMMDFWVTDPNTASYYKAGTGSINRTTYTNNFNSLPDHTALLISIINNSFANQGDAAMTNFPFFRTGQRHWGIKGQGNRWECDDQAVTFTKDTHHQIWIR